MENLVQKAIQAALRGEWEKAEKLNLQILANSPNDTAALNRLSLAQTQLGKIKEAKKTLRLVLDLDPANPIAFKRLKMLKKAKKKGSKKTEELENVFLQEKGKTKIFSPVKLAGIDVLTNLSVGEKLDLVPKKTIIQLKKGKTYIGTIPDLLSFHLLSLLKKGYRYEVYVWKIEPKNFSVFLKEVFRPKKYQGLPSFP